ncbi:MAG TPA: hypothetical protein VFN25_04725 [Dokdonella sp.]|uniref:hypothetical protein n=1 Tax=Dokdonella sp. TaxID=2291710 RepID=UPI002D801E24|nr:hypothetical protein [Dokdonella sp.]HET9032191.1 hypothetical protein [Dokdonella sp.]
MKFPFKTLGLLLASMALASCGGGGSDGGATSAPQPGSITLTASRTTLPLNPGNILPYPGSPFMAEVAFTYRNNAGVITALTSDATFTTSSPSTISLSPPDDPSTDENEMASRVVSFNDTTNNGSYVFFATSYDVAGTSVVTASATDPATGLTVSKTLTFTVQGAPPVPGSVNLTPSPSVIYVAGVGGVTSSTISAQVRDGANQPVPDPGSADNVKFEIVGDAGGGILSAPSGSGANVTAKTVAGIAAVSFQSGTTLPPGPVQIRATVDRADNNVSNGISDPISATTSVAVSDGKLFGVVITSPDLEAVTANHVFAGVDANGNPVGGLDGTYSFTISALATDRQGNPVVPGTTIQFGVIDAPLSGFPSTGGGVFDIAGGDGNPLEGGTAFTAPTGHFTTAGGGAGPGDTLLVFGQLVTGNFDLENARVVSSIANATNLTVTSAFNRNDTTGSSVNYGAVLPYVIGRATEANITASATTNAVGVASTTLNYPVSRLGKQTIVWAQGNAATSSVVRTVGDIQPVRLPGVAPLTIAVSPSPLLGNTTTSVTVCVYDAFNSPLQGIFPGFSFHDLGIGSGSIDGVSGSGNMSSATGSDGCTVGTVVTAGLSGGGSGGGGAGSPGVIFNVGNSEPVDIPISVSTGLLLQAFPSSTSGGAVNLLLTDGNGNPVPNAQIAGVCTGGPSIVGQIAPTGANGQTVASILPTGLACVAQGEPRNTGTCVFSTGVQGGPTATVTVLGPVDPDPPASPPEPCGN